MRPTPPGQTTRVLRPAQPQPPGAYPQQPGAYPQQPPQPAAYQQPQGYGGYQQPGMYQQPAPVMPAPRTRSTGVYGPQMAAAHGYNYAPPGYGPVPGAIPFGVPPSAVAFDQQGFACSRANWLAALLLCLFFACFGVHRFIAGRIGSGIAMILMWLASVVFLILMFVESVKLEDKNQVGSPVAVLVHFILWVGLLLGVSIWTLVDLILIIMGKFKDKYGLPIKSH